MNEKPVITVVTPYYNNAETIFGSLSSVLFQTYKNVQYVLIDDGSSDFDEEKIRAFLDTHQNEGIREYTVLRNEKNLGTVKSLNRAIREAKGTLIFTLAADDCFSDENVLTDWANEFFLTNAEIITAKRAVYDNEMKNFVYFAPNAEEIDLIQGDPQKLFDRIAVQNFVFGCCTAYTKAFYDRLGGFDERYRLVEDQPALLKAIRMGVRINFFDRVVVHYRLGGVSNTGNINRSYLHQSDKIFFRDAFPYVSKKGATLRAYLVWRNKRLIPYDKKRLSRRHNRQKPLGRFLYLTAMTFLHPVHMIKRKKNSSKEKRSAK